MSVVTLRNHPPFSLSPLLFALLFMIIVIKKTTTERTDVLSKKKKAETSSSADSLETAAAPLPTIFILEKSNEPKKLDFFEREKR